MDYIEYINGIKDKIAALPEEYCFSSAINYAGLDDDLEVVLLDFFENDCGNGLKIRYPKREYLLQIRAFGIIQIINNSF